MSKKTSTKAQKEFDKAIRPARDAFYKSTEIAQATCAQECAEARTIFEKIYDRANAVFDKAILKDGK